MSTPLWASNTAVISSSGWTDVMGAGYSVFPGGMAVGDYLYDPNGRFQLYVTSSKAELADMNTSGVLWGWYGSNVSSLIIGKDGNMYLYAGGSGKGDGTILQQTSFAASQGATLQLQADGDLCIYAIGQHE
jgi:hypothetical protein